jgi:2-dehydropantoate 2-reductase
MSLKYAVIGTGALGGFYGGMLARAGKEVHFLFNSDYNHVKDQGLKIDSISGDFHLHNIFAYHSTTKMPVCDVVLVCLKTTNNAVLKEMLPPLLHQNTIIILIQNGLEVENDISVMFPETYIAGGLAFICASKIGPGHIAHHDYGKLNIGAHNTVNPELLQQVCNDFNEANVSTHLSHDLLKSRWQKLVWNVPFNGLTVVLNTTTDQLVINHEARQLVHDLMMEIIHGANHCGVHLEHNFADKMIELTENMAPYAPSMKLDFDYNRPMEIEYIYTRPIEAANRAGYEMKKVSMLEKQLRFMEIQNKVIRN